MRESWKTNTSFVMAAIGSAVGLGNLWRFPYIAYRNGGGAFLIPYFIALLTTGIPLLIVEFAFGYIYKGSAPDAMKKIKSKFEWVGWWAVLVGFVIVIYYMAVMSWSAVYTYHSFKTPWKGNEGYFFMNNILNSAPAVTPGNIILKNDGARLNFKMNGEQKKLKENKLSVQIYRDGPEDDFSLKNIKAEKVNFEIYERPDLTLVPLSLSVTLPPSDSGEESGLNEDTLNAEILFTSEAMNKIKTAGIVKPFSQIFKFSPHLIIGLVIAWVLVYLIIYKGVGRVGKIVSYTVPLPVILLLVIFLRGITQPGALDGILHYLRPDFSLLANPNVWLDAYSQIFFSLSIGFGIMIAYSSYMKKGEITNNACITAFANCATSFFTGFAVFSIIGYLAVLKNVDIAQTVAGGPGLAFVVFPSALANLPGISAPLFSFLFFITLLTLGIDSAFSLVEAIVAAIEDKFQGRIKRKTITMAVCITGFILGLIFVSRSGLYWLDVVDNWMNKFGLTPVAIAMCIIAGYMMNIKKLRRQINEHSIIKLNGLWDICVKYISPAVLIYLIGVNIFQEIKAPYEGYPQWMINIGGWGVAVALIFIALFLMESKDKWRYKIIVGFITLIICLTAMNYATLAVFILGSVFLFGGLAYFLLTALKNK